ncbi:MAG TPA: hypothetical protein VN956_22300 [Pyrinomonadaceae bacterium]|nr:hypothetical protein [Pyrinomonadaceae bacterium]
MKKLTIIFLLALMSLALVAADSARTNTIMAAAVQGEIFTIADAGIQFQLPRGWKTRRDGDATYVSTGDESVQMVFFVPDEDTFDLTLRELDKELGKTIKKIKTTDRGTSDTHNGMRHFSTGGTGEFDGSAVEWGVDVLDAKKVVIVLTFADPGAFDDHVKDGGQFISSIKRMQPAPRPPAPAREDRVLTNPEAGLQFELPRGWKATEKGDDMLISTADETVQIDFWIPDEETFDLALRGLDKDLGKIIKNVKITDRGTSDTHNGMRHFSTSGTGTVNGRRCEWSVDVLDAKKVALILSFWAPGLADRHASEGEQFFTSIKKMK